MTLTGYRKPNTLKLNVILGISDLISLEQNKVQDGKIIFKEVD